MSHEPNLLTPRLSLVAWEITRKCNLLCAHCRAEALDTDYIGELSTQECFRVVDSILEVGQPILILTGGEPLLRPDVFEIGKYSTERGLRVVIGSNGTIITDELAARMAEVPISRVGISLDFPVPDLQDKFRGKSGAFDAAVAGIKAAQKAGIEVQINSTITRMNAPHLEALLGLALDLGAVAFHPFMLVPTGRGKGLASEELPAEEYERILNWVYEKQSQLGDRIFFKPTDAPHYMRIAAQRRGKNPFVAHPIQHSPKEMGARGFSERLETVPNSPESPSMKGQSAMNRTTRGCLAGVGFCFISHVGRVQGCGYLDVAAGDLKKESFSQVWNGSSLFNELRDLSGIKGKCGECEYKRLCGGCRARAYESTGDYLQAEPYCVYQPAKGNQSESNLIKGSLDETDRRLLNLLQTDFPLTLEPFADIGSKIGIDEAEVIQRVSRLKEDRIIRSIGPVFDSRALGYESTLVAMRFPSERIESAAQIINQHPGVGHNYQRDHTYNLWFTLAVRNKPELARTLCQLEEQLAPEAMVELPALRIFKIRLFFDLEGTTSRKQTNQKTGGARRAVPLEPAERAVINQVQTNLPIVPRPFDEMASSAGMEVNEFLAQCRSLRGRGIMRRFGGTLDQRNAGFVANALVCWAVPQDRVDEVGQQMAAFPQVTHCYERQTSARWPRFNIFTMIHAKTVE
ncbi:MAG: radical SAM protein, partial [Dehalococcoidia bacterium]|nr:radical SAM protein [Dehalococcoidia bacterium]